MRLQDAPCERGAITSCCTDILEADALSSRSRCRAYAPDRKRKQVFLLVRTADPPGDAFDTCCRSECDRVMLSGWNGLLGIDIPAEWQHNCLMASRFEPGGSCFAAVRRSRDEHTHLPVSGPAREKLRAGCAAQPFGSLGAEFSGRRGLAIKPCLMGFATIGTDDHAM